MNGLLSNLYNRLTAISAAPAAPPPLYCLTLAEEPHKQAIVEQHLGSLGLAATFVPAFYGLTLGLEATTPFAVNPDGTRQYLHINAIGCFLSHLAALRLAIASGSDTFIVLEDDALLCPDFGNCLARLLAAVPTGTDILNLELFDTDRAKPGSPVNDFCRRVYWPFGSAAIWWRREAALLALQRLHPISLPYDIGLMNLVYPFSHLVVADPPLVKQRSVIGEWPSAVQVEKAAVH